ncbi:carbon-nitrogen hydrolase family protein [Alteribacillus iranensis]|uniref:Predicted amidohydrolase n=1 Tax=Alteribacillus iranensis TaxID=930128 RepID=A0A1I2BFL4_9BACI|nr:carbon-nitrogen hydrolase family protein [Alteribacillus iranensis]SFE54906.1 Predicted amidohydrolase [Alteribacillus iranensis]
MKSINVSLAQLKPKLADKKNNLKQIAHAISKAKNENSDLIVFPELFLTGYSVEDKVNILAEDENGPHLEEIKKLCTEHSIYAVVGFAEKDQQDHYYISTALINDNGNIVDIYRKTHLFDEEKKYFSAGSELKVIQTPIGNIGMMICFDVEFPEVARILKLKNADFLVIANANMDPYEEHHRLYARCRAMENEIPVIICNRLGKEKDLNFCGDSMVIDATGSILLEMKDNEGVKTVELPLQQALDPKMRYIVNRRSTLYSSLLKDRITL